MLATMILFSSSVAMAHATPTQKHRVTVVKTYNAKVSWYKTGKITANGEKFTPNNLTVAHKHLPFGTIVEFTNNKNNKTIIARVNDRGPYVKGREFDLSIGAAKYLDIVHSGVAILEVKIYKL